MAPPKRAGAARTKPKVNPIRQIANRDHNRAVREASIASSRASSVAPSIAGSRAGSIDPFSRAGSVVPFGSPPPPVRRCKAAHCTGTKVGPEGICMSCGTVVQEDSNIVSEIQFGETAGGAAYVTGVSVAYGEAGPRMNITNGNRQVAGNGGGKSNQATLQQAQLCFNTIVTKLGRLAIPSVVQERASYQFQKIQATGWVRGRTVDRVAAACLYYAVRSSEFTGAMLIDIADAINADVFILGRWFKQLLLKLHGKPDGNGKMVIANCPFEPLYPEDIIRVFSTRLGFKDKTDKVREDAVRILQRMDRDWIVSGRKPAGICGTALVIAARMNDLRRTVLEICYAARIGHATVELRLEEFRRLESSKLTVTDFREKAFFTKEAADPPAFYRQSKEYLEEQEQKRAARKRKRPVANGEDDQDGEGEASNPNEEHRPGNDRATTSPASQLRTDADGFAIPARPNNSQAVSTSTQSQGQPIRALDIAEAMPLDEDDEQIALAVKYGGIRVPRAKQIRKNRMQGSSLREPECDPEDKLTLEEEETMNALLAEITNTQSDVYAAAASFAGVQTEVLLANLESTRPIKYRADEAILAEVLETTEFDDDPEIMNCLLTPEERALKEKLWLNENKQWLREQQEKAYKARTAPPKKSRRKNPRKARIGEGQATPASSAGEAAEMAAKRLKFSKKLDYSKIGNMFKDKAPGSEDGSAAQTSGAGSPAEESDSEDLIAQDMAMDEAGSDEDEFVEDYDEQGNMDDDGEEFGGGYEDDDY